MNTFGLPFLGRVCELLISAPFSLWFFHFGRPGEFGGRKPGWTATGHGGQWPRSSGAPMRGDGDVAAGRPAGHGSDYKPGSIRRHEPRWLGPLLLVRPHMVEPGRSQLMRLRLVLLGWVLRQLTVSLGLYLVSVPFIPAIMGKRDEVNVGLYNPSCIL